MATQSQEFARLSSLFPQAPFYVPIEDRMTLNHALPEDSDISSPKIISVRSEGDFDPIHYVACCDGELLYIPKNNQSSRLLLLINPSVVTQLMACIPEDQFPVNIITYEDIDEDSLRTFVINKLTLEGTNQADSERQVEAFFQQAFTLSVQGGELFGQSKGSEAVVSISDTNGFLIHPVYLFWRWLNLERTIEPGEHRALTQFDWQDMELSVDEFEINGAISHGTAITTSIGSYRNEGY